MGYRMYLAKAKKSAELTETLEDKSIKRNEKNIESIFELGKYVDWRQDGSVNILGENHESELYKVDKEFLLYLIERYRVLNFNYYSDLLKKVEPLYQELLDSRKSDNSDGLVALSNIVNSLYGKAGDEFSEWGEKRNCLQLKDSEDGKITKSWLYEYSIFNLVHILHTFDWENDDLIYMGY